MTLASSRALHASSPALRHRTDARSRPEATAHPSPGPRPAHARPRATATQVFREAESGDVVVRFHLTDIVRVRPCGDVALDSGGYLTPTTFASLNDALAVIGARLTAKGEVEEGMWTVSDGRSLLRFQARALHKHACLLRRELSARAHPAARPGRGGRRRAL